MRFEHKFKVRGQRAFPIDMLRYDRCWPATRQDSRQIERFVKQEGDATGCVGLLSVSEESHWRPASDRWRTFGWPMLEHTRIRTDLRL